MSAITIGISMDKILSDGDVLNTETSADMRIITNTSIYESEKIFIQADLNTVEAYIKNAIEDASFIGPDDEGFRDVFENGAGYVVIGLNNSPADEGD